MLAAEIGVTMRASATANPCSRRAAAVKCSAAFSGRQGQAAPRIAAARPSIALLAPRRPRGCISASAAPAAVGKLISKVEIPAFIPRSDILEQIMRWALIEVQGAGVANVGCPCKVTPYLRGDVTWGFTVSFLKDGVSASDVRVAFDEETTMKHEWVGKGVGLLPHGFPMLEGNYEAIDGKNFEIRKTDDTVVTEPIRASIREFCTMLVAAINKYYAFGSCFVDDTT